MKSPLRRTFGILFAGLSLLTVSTACSPMGPVRTMAVESVDVEQYLGTWYEIASVKLFFSVGLVNSTANYSLNDDGSIKVVNTGNYFFKDGPLATITGSAVPVDNTNAKLNVSFTGSNSAEPPGNYWIVDLDEDYQWAIVSDQTGETGFILSRTRTVSQELRAELLERASAAGVNLANMTETQQL